MQRTYEQNLNRVAKISGVQITPSRVHACIVLALLQEARTDGAQLDVLERQLRIAREDA